MRQPVFGSRRQRAKKAAGVTVAEASSLRLPDPNRDARRRELSRVGTARRSRGSESSVHAPPGTALGQDRRRACRCRNLSPWRQAPRCDCAALAGLTGFSKQARRERHLDSAERTPLGPHRIGRPVVAYGVLLSERLIARAEDEAKQEPHGGSPCAARAPTPPPSPRGGQKAPKRAGR